MTLFTVYKQWGIKTSQNIETYYTTFFKYLHCREKYIYYNTFIKNLKKKPTFYYLVYIVDGKVETGSVFRLTLSLSLILKQI